MWRCMEKFMRIKKRHSDEGDREEENEKDEDEEERKKRTKN